MDYYTAVDDLNKEGETGAGMVGFTSFNSACFYRYACIDWDQLVVNLRGDKDLAKTTVEAFLRAAIEAVPSGKQKSFAANNPPCFMLGTVRENNQGWSLANAFEVPIRANYDGGNIIPSIEAIDQYWDRLVKVYNNEAARCVVCLSIEKNASLFALSSSIVDDFNTWVGKILSALPAGG